MRQIIYTISLILLLGACTDEKYTDRLSSEGARPGELVPVELALNTQPIQSPLSSGTKAGDDVVSSTLACKGMEISLVGTPVTRSSTTYEDEIKNFWVFQFDGTVPTSTLVWKQFIDSNSVKEVLLTPSISGKKDRIIVIANAGETAFNDLQESSSTLADFENKAIGYNESSKVFPPNFPLLNIGTGGTIPFTGSTDMIVTANKQADIMLYRSVARAKVNLSLSAEMQNKGYTAWSYQFMSIPKKSFYHSIGRTAAFPGDAVGYANYAPGQISFPATITTNLPVNLHPSVPYTTQEKRATNAPTGATYLQLMGMKMNGNIISRSVVYQIHLGSNFTDDYSISPNYSYTYNIKITGENDDDSRVIKFIPGYFGGELKMYTESGSATPNQAKAFTWRYDKRIEVYITDVNGQGGIKWMESGSLPNLNSLMDGRQNTWDLRNQTNYPALQRCIGLNGTPAPATIDEMAWYMPSYGQSLGIYVSGSNTLKTLPNTYYWSSTANNSFAWGTEVWTGRSTLLGTDKTYNLRCVKDLIPGNLASE